MERDRDKMWSRWWLILREVKENLVEHSVADGTFISIVYMVSWTISKEDTKRLSKSEIPVWSKPVFWTQQDHCTHELGAAMAAYTSPSSQARQHSSTKGEEGASWVPATNWEGVDSGDTCWEKESVVFSDAAMVGWAAAHTQDSTDWIPWFSLIF